MTTAKKKKAKVKKNRTLLRLQCIEEFNVLRKCRGQPVMTPNSRKMLFGGRFAGVDGAVIKYCVSGALLVFIAVVLFILIRRRNIFGRDNKKGLRAKNKCSDKKAVVHSINDNRVATVDKNESEFSFDPYTVHVPKGSVSESTRITVVVKPCTNYIHHEGKRYVPIAPILSCETDCQKFKKPLKVTTQSSYFSRDPNKLVEVQVFFRQTATCAWQKITDTALGHQGQVSWLIDHFSEAITAAAEPVIGGPDVERRMSTFGNLQPMGERTKRFVWKLQDFRPSDVALAQQNHDLPFQTFTFAPRNGLSLKLVDVRRQIIFDRATVQLTSEELLMPEYWSRSFLLQLPLGADRSTPSAVECEVYEEGANRRVLADRMYVMWNAQAAD